MKFDSLYFNCPVRVPGSRTTTRLAIAKDGFSFEKTADGFLISRDSGTSWVPNTSIEYAVVVTEVEKPKAKPAKE